MFFELSRNDKIRLRCEMLSLAMIRRGMLASRLSVLFVGGLLVDVIFFLVIGLACG